MADFTNRNADETKQFILTFDENGGSPEYTKIEDANGVDRTAEVVELLGINDKEDADSTILKEGDVEDSLNSTSTTKPLSANQGKQLNDDKASLSGGASANFALMPQVGGMPIVEGGSNSDGEFVRFDNGLQVCFGVTNITGDTGDNQFGDNNNFYGSNEFSVDYPSPFDSPATFTGQVDMGFNTWIATRRNNSTEQSPDFGVIRWDAREFDNNIHWTAIGRWK